MNNNQLDIESLERLIVAVGEYQESLTRNRQILVNAANVCDQAMGSDAIAKKHIAKLREALKELTATAITVSNVATALKEDRRLALRTLEDDE